MTRAARRWSWATLADAGLQSLLLALLAASVLVFAILAARPRISTQPITLEDLANSQGNILFFGNFANLEKEQFTEGMLELMQDKQVLYETMIHNIHDIGMVLNRKFGLLKLAYTSFMFALILGVLSFMAVFVWILQQAG